jgi:gamma-glutamyl:cysteine ligase YbdK (ATP-grasp superfamily)
VIEQLVAAGALEDYARTWWDVRPHPRFGTVEDAIALAAVERILRTGNGADRQLDAFAATGDAHAVARDIAARSEN